MSATRGDIERWFDSGVEQRYEFMIAVRILEDTAKELF